MNKRIADYNSLLSFRCFVSSTYSRLGDQFEIPDGWEVLGFTVPTIGQFYLDHQKGTVNKCERPDFSFPRLVLVKKKTQKIIDVRFNSYCDNCSLRLVEYQQSNLSWKKEVHEISDCIKYINVRLQMLEQNDGE